jgi:dienelactone hydrolase
MPDETNSSNPPNSFIAWLRPRIWVVVPIACIALLIYFWSPIRAHMQAAAISLEMQGKRIPILLAPVAHHDAGVNGISVPVPNAPDLKALLYAPTSVENPRGILLLHGIQRLGMDDPRLTMLATALAASGFQVLTPDFADLRDYRVTPATIQQIGASAHFLAARTGHPVGIIGMSFSGGLALMAAADPAYARDICCIQTIGAHDSMEHVVRYYLDGYSVLPDGTRFNLAPHQYGPLVVEYEHLSAYVPPQDVAPLKAVLRAILYEDLAGQKLLSARLTPAQKVELAHLLDPRNPEMLDDTRSIILKNLPSLTAVSPAGNVAGLRAHVYLLQGSTDNVIPASEIFWLQHDLPAGTVQSALLTPLMTHVNFDQTPAEQPSPSWSDRWKIVHEFALFLEDVSK